MLKARCSAGILLDGYTHLRSLRHWPKETVHVLLIERMLFKIVCLKGIYSELACISLEFYRPLIEKSPAVQQEVIALLNIAPNSI